mgnify:CR=1 FL=1
MPVPKAFQFAGVSSVVDLITLCPIKTIFYLALVAVLDPVPPSDIGNGELNVTVFPKEFLAFEHLIKKGNYVQIVGSMQQNDLPSLVVKQMKIFNLKEEA